MPSYPCHWGERAYSSTLMRAVLLFGVVQARAMAHECLEALSMRLGNDLFFGGSKCAGTRTQPCNMRTTCKSCNMQIVQHARQHANHATCMACNVHGLQIMQDMQHANHATCGSQDVQQARAQHARRATCTASNVQHAACKACNMQDVQHACKHETCRIYPVREHS